MQIIVFTKKWKLALVQCKPFIFIFRLPAEPERDITMMLNKQIEQHLNSGLNRQQVFEKMQGIDDDEEIIYHVNTLCPLAYKRQYMAVNLVLVGLLALLTGKKILAVVGYSYFDMYAIAALVVPIVNTYIIRQLVRFHRNGYRFLFMLSILSLVHEENRHAFELTTTLAMIVLSGFLYMKLFGRETLVLEVDN